jgi:signal transduction histidine kinase
MSWINWVYLVIGLGLGLGSHKAFAQRDKKSVNEEKLVQTQQLPLATPTETVLVEQLRQTQLAYQLVQELSQFKAGFLVRTAHELRSPLNSLIGLHQLILSDLCDDPAEEREFVDQAQQMALKLVELLDEILDVARIANNKETLEIQPLQLTAVIEEIEHLTQTLAANRNIKLQISSLDPETYILADPQWLRFVLLNLVETCIQTIEAGSLAISAQLIPNTETAYISFDVPLSIETWSESLDAMHFEQQMSLQREDKSLSPGFKLLLNQTVLELMQASLSFLPISSATDVPMTRIQISIPLVIPEAEFPE